MGSDDSPEEKVPEAGLEETAEVSAVSAMAPPYSKHRDLLIKGFVILLLAVVVVGGYLLIKGAGSALEDLRKNPVEFVTRLVWGEGPFETCRSFVRENPRLFGHLGKDVGLTVLRQEVRVVNRARTARIVARAQGDRDKETVFFFLERRKGRWRVATVASRTSRGEYKTLYPERTGAPNKA